MKIDLMALGIDKEEMRQCIIDGAVQTLLNGLSSEDDIRSDMVNSIEQKVQHAIVTQVDKFAAESVEPIIAEIVKNVVIRPTNRYGESTGEPKTLTEQLVDECTRWMTAKVDTHGKSREETTSSFWSGEKPRIVGLIHEHLDYRVRDAVTAAMGDAHKIFGKSLEEFTKEKLSEIAAAFKISTGVTGE